MRCFKLKQTVYKRLGSPEKVLWGLRERLVLDTGLADRVTFIWKSREEDSLDPGSIESRVTGHRQTLTVEGKMTALIY